jgi:hypothetical protein
MNTMSAEDRFWQNVLVVENCWEWIGPRNGNGYGLMSINNVTRGAHRRAWELFRGPIPADMTIDHLCRNRGCVNPNHLEVVSFRTNVLRGNGPTAKNARSETCIRGHQYAVDDRGRWCPVCARDKWLAKHPPKARATMPRDERRAKDRERLRAWRAANPERYASQLARRKAALMVHAPKPRGTP